VSQVDPFLLRLKEWIQR